MEIMMAKRRKRGRRCKGDVEEEETYETGAEPDMQVDLGTTERHVRTFLLSLTQPSHDHISRCRWLGPKSIALHTEAKRTNTMRRLNSSSTIVLP
jgi:hypothetical protein